MHHVAILAPQLQMLPKILSGQKTIESRWYKVHTAPWNRIARGDTVYFKDSGKPVTAMVNVARVLQFEHCARQQLHDLVTRYGGEGKICFDNPEQALRWVGDKKHVILIFLANAKPVRPFAISKRGFGSACAWLTVSHINRLKV